MDNGKHTISFIGAGNVAFGLGNALSKCANIQFIYSRTYESAVKLSRKIGGKPTGKLLELLASDFIICAVDDDSLTDVADNLGKIKLGKRDPVIVHTSGSVSGKVFSGISKRYGVFYPLQTFTFGRKVNMRKVPIFINAGTEPALIRIRALAESISDRVEEMDDDARGKLHIPAVIVNNFVNHLIYKAEALAEELGLEKSYYHPLLHETVRKAIKKDPFEAQTGPAIRRDLGVIQKHKKALKGHDDLLKIYNLITESIINTYHEDTR